MVSSKFDTAYFKAGWSRGKVGMKEGYSRKFETGIHQILLFVFYFFLESDCWFLYVSTLLYNFRTQIVIKTKKFFYFFN